ncbi:MAG: hypothetical protein WC781_04560 [Candidatus Pacearchaeota archaeon]|jgi:hypothetical protein
MKYKIKDITPEKIQCVAGACPAIYEGIQEITPGEMKCVLGACPSNYRASREGKEVYLIVGKQINPSDAGLESKVGKGETLIEVPRALIDKRE